MLNDRQKDLDEAAETFRNVGSALQSTGRDARGGIAGINPDGSRYDPTFDPGEPPSPVPDYPTARDIAVIVASELRPDTVFLEEEETDAPELVQESDESYPPWLPWAVAGGAGIWALTRKPK